MNTMQNYSRQTIRNEKVFQDLNKVLDDQINYGLEYVLDEIFPEKNDPTVRTDSRDWFGLTDLLI